MAGLIGNRYEPMETVARGAGGEVTRALDRRHGRDVALKLRVVRRDEDREPLVAAAGRLLHLAPHPRLPVVRDEFFVGNRHCLVVDWVAGSSLQEQLERRGTLPLGEVVTRVTEVADALEHLHAQHPPVVHGDVKPANVRLGADGTAVLVDLGLGVSPAGLPTNPSAFAAPELVAGDRAPPADVYSLAATALNLLLGRSPSPGGASLAEGTGRVDPAIEFALRLGLATDPERRPTVAALAGAMAEAVRKPAPMSPFVGRAGLLADLKGRLGATRLLTLTGAGGIGKSRLAHRLAAEVAPHDVGRVVLVDLGPLVDPEMVLDEIVARSGLEARGATLVDELLCHLRGQPTFMVLDNCDHVVTACARLAEEMLEACPALRILATSREPLRVSGERVCVVPTLSTPPAGERDHATLARHEAVQLFVQEAVRARGAFAVTAANSSELVQLCRRLDGMPLALELAAERLAEVPLAELVERLDGPLRLLARTSPAPIARHQSLDACLGWTYETLSSAERQFFERLSQLGGDFDVDAAEGLGAGDGADSTDVFELLSALVDKSMVITTDDGETSRYRILEPLRRFGVARACAAEPPP